MPTGTVKWFSTGRSYGYIKPDDDTADVFVHLAGVRNAGLPGLREGQKVSFDLQCNRGMRTAANLKKA